MLAQDAIPIAPATSARRRRHRRRGPAAALRVLASASEPLIAIAQLLAPRDLQQLLRVSRAAGAALRAVGAMRSFAFAQTHVRAWVVRAVAPVFDGDHRLSPLASTPRSIWNEVFRIWSAPTVRPRSPADKVYKLVLGLLAAEPWHELPVAFWAALVVLFKMDARIIGLLICGEIVTMVDKDDWKRLHSAMKDNRVRLSAMLRLVVAASVDNPNARKTGFGQNYLTVSHMAGFLGDVQLLEDVHDAFFQKGFQSDLRVVGTSAAKVSALRIIEYLVSNNPETAIALCGPILGMLREKSNTDLVEKMVKLCTISNANVNPAERTEALKMLLNFAIEGKSAKTVNEILDWWTDVDDQTLQVSIFTALNQGDVLVLSVLIDHGASVEAKNIQSQGLMHLAAKYGQCHIVELLADRGASIEPRDGYGNTPLHHASMYGRVDICRLLLRLGADIESVGQGGNHPIHVAKCPKVMKTLLELGASPHSRTSEGNTPLHAAVFGGISAHVILLLLKKVDLEAENSHGERPMHLATDTETVRVLAAAGAETSAPDGLGLTPLHRAARDGSGCILTCLVAAGADIEARERQNGRRPLHLAALEDRWGCASELLRCGAAPDACDDDGLTPLMLATQRGHHVTVSSLLQGGADPECARAGDDGRRALHLVAKHGRYRVMMALLSRPVDVAARDARDRTPLHYAARHGYASLVRALLEAGAATDCRDEDGCTPKDLAKKAGSARVLWALRDHQTQQALTA
ncbi:Ankyrin repeat domain-containing protein 61, partial [Cladochytrium tenue]